VLLFIAQPGSLSRPVFAVKPEKTMMTSVKTATIGALFFLV